MAETTKVRLRVISRITDEQGQTFETKNARHGTLVSSGEMLVLEYDDEQEGERAHIALTMEKGCSAAENRVQMKRTGMTSGVLSFLPGRRTPSVYVTIYGEIPIQIDTRRVLIVNEQENGGGLQLEYDVYMGGERTSGAKLDITWRC